MDDEKNQEMQVLIKDKDDKVDFISSELNPSLSPNSVKESKGSRKSQSTLRYEAILLL